MISDTDKKISKLINVFKENQHKKIAGEQAAYMRNQFDFLGISSPVRKELQKPFLQKKYLPGIEQIELITKQLWNEPYREFQYFAQEFVFQYRKKFEKKHIKLLEYMISHKSWWDTVDFIATKLAGNYFILYPEKRNKYIDKWKKSGNIWLQRSSILFQLKYKEQTDFELLGSIIRQLNHTDEFFIDKAIGWALREYSKTNPGKVKEFIANTHLSKLSIKEGSKYLK
jgi:3-methyladenine DNA glycosylase AlkD